MMSMHICRNPASVSYTSVVLSSNAIHLIFYKSVRVLIFFGCGALWGVALAVCLAKNKEYEIEAFTIK